MAKLTLTVDTDDHSLTADVNGAPIGLNVDNINIYNFGSADRPRYTFCICTRDVADDMVMRTTIEASLAPAGSTQSTLAADLRDSFERDEADAARQLAEFYARGR